MVSRLCQNHLASSKMNTFTSIQECPGGYIFLRRPLSATDGRCLGHSTIDTLSDDVLLCIFDSYRREVEEDLSLSPARSSWPWPGRDLVHVCRRWRRIAFGYPHYLKLYPSCNSKPEVQAALNIWPALPLSIVANLNTKDAYRFLYRDTIISALEHRDRVADIGFWEFNHSQLEQFVPLMQEPFPDLRSLGLTALYENMAFVITDTFLGGSAPLLQKIHIHGIRLPGLPKLFSSTNGLVFLKLEGFPMTGEGHLSPDAMTTCLSVLTKLQSLTITTCFLRWTSSPYPTDQCPTSSTHNVLPALTHLFLQGPHGYLEDFVARVDAPLLDDCDLYFTDKPTFDTPRVPQFIRRTKTVKLLDGVNVHFSREYGGAAFCSSIGPAEFGLTFPRSGLPVQVALTERICAQWPPLVSRVEFLKLSDDYYAEEEKTLLEATTAWLGLLRRFTAVQTLRLVGRATMFHVGHILAELERERAMEVLPALRTIELSAGGGFPQDRSETLGLLGPFLAAREEWEHPVVVKVCSKS